MLALEYSSAVAYDPVTGDYFDPDTTATIDHARGAALAQSEIAAGLIVAGVNDDDSVNTFEAPSQIPEVSVTVDAGPILPWLFLAALAWLASK